MLYKNYKRRLERIAKIIDFIKKHKVLILCCIGTLFALIMAFVSVRGIITSPLKLSASKIVYGQEISGEANAFCRDVCFEYKLDGEDEWKDGLPEKAGTYLVRGYSRRAFGILNYTNEETVVIQQKALELKPDDSDLTYGQEPTVIAELKAGDSIVKEDIKFLYDRGVGNIDFSIDEESIKIINDNGEIVTSCYQINTISELIMVKQKQVKLTVDGKSQEYNGQALSSESYQINELAFDDRLEIEFSESITDVGSIFNTPTYKIVNKDGQDVSAYYKVSKKIGKLTVTPRPITIKVKDRQETYDSTEYTCNDYEIVLGRLIDGHSVGKFTFIGARTNVGLERIKFDEFIIWDTEEKDVSSNYKLTLNHGELHILSREITVDAEGSKVYDAQSLCASNLNDGVTIKQGSLVDGQEIVVFTTSDNAGSYDKNAVSHLIKHGETDVSSNYLVIYDSVSMDISRREVVITAKSKEKTYDASPLKCNSDDYTITNLVVGHKETVKLNGEITEVGNTPSIAICNLIMSDQKNVTLNYNIVCEPGTLTITKRAVKVWADVEKTYDDTTEIPNGTINIYVYKVEDNGTETAGLYGEQKIKATFKIDGDLRNKGLYNDGIVVDGEVEIENGSIDNYDVTYLKGTLKVNARKIIITTATGSKVYNGQAQILDEATVENLVAGHCIKYKNWKELTDVAEPVFNTVEVDRIHAIGNEEDDKTANYEFEEHFVWGKFNITPRPLKGTIESEEDLSKIYDDEKYEGIVDNSLFPTEIQESNKLVDGHHIKVDTYEYVNAGTYSIKGGNLRYVIYNGGEDVTKNYDVSDFNVKATIEKRDITVYALDVTKTYDAMAYEKEHSDLVVDNLVESHVLTATVVGSSANVMVGSYTSVKADTLKITRANGEDVTGNYNTPTFVDGTLTVIKRAVKVWADVEKTYDDTTEIPNGTINIYVYKVEDNGTETAGLYGEQKIKATFKIDGDLRNKGLYNDGIVVDGEVEIENGSIDNYDVTYLKGTLKVNARKIIITTATGSKVYNGQAQILDEATVENLVAGHCIKYKNWKELTDVAEPVFNTVEVDRIHAIGNEEDDKTANYEFEEHFVWGKFNITPRPLKGTIESEEDLSKIYDDEKYEGIVDNSLFPTEIQESNKLVDGHHIKVDTYEYVNAGTYSIKGGNLRYVIYNGGEDVTKNYDVSDFNVKATIEKRDITVYALDVTKTYDAMAYEKEHSDLVVDNLVESHVLTATVVGSSANVMVGSYTSVKADTLKITRANGEDVTGNYNTPTFVDGTLTITKRGLRVKVDLEKTYDDTNVFSIEQQQVCIEMLNDLEQYQQIESVNSIATLYGEQQIALVALIRQGYECIDAGLYVQAVSCSYSISFNGESVDGSGFSYVDNYDVIVVFGNATINKRAISLRMVGASKSYDRQPLTNDEIKIIAGSVANGHKIEVDGELPTIDYVGEIYNDITFVIKKGDIDKTHNYDTSDKKIEKLVITKASLKIRIYGKKTTYNGLLQKFDVMRVRAESGLLDGDNIAGYNNWLANGNVVEGNAVENVGVYQISAMPVIAIAAADKYYTDFLDYYNIEIINGNFEILRCKLTIKTLDIERTEAIDNSDTAEAYNISGGKIPTGQSVTAIVTGEQLWKGSSKNKVAYVVVNGEQYEINGDGDYECGNYLITIKEGMLTYS